MGYSYEDDEVKVYSQRGEGTFSDDNYNRTAVGEEAVGNNSSEMTVEDFEALKRLRSLEKKIDPDAIQKTDDFNEGLYNQLSSSDIDLVAGLSGFLRGYGVIEDKNYQIETKEDAGDLFSRSSAAAMSDYEVNPDNYDKGSEEALEILQVIAQQEEVMTINPELDEEDSEYGDIIRGHSENDDDYDEDLDFAWDEEDDDEDVLLSDDYDEELDGGYLEDAETGYLDNELDAEFEAEEEDDVQNIHSTNFGHTYDDLEELSLAEITEEEDVYHSSPVDHSTRKLSIDDMITIKRLFALGKLTDTDISAIYTGLSVSDVGRLREELS